MGLPYPENTTPDASPYTTIQINEYWWSVIFGFADNALIRESWDVTDEQWTNEVEPAVINALDTAMNCDCINGLDFDPITGKLTYTDGNGNTVTVQTSGDTFISNNYYVITANEADADDAYCYAAHLLSEHASDDLQDMLEIVDVLEDSTLSVVSEIFASFVDLVPLLGDLAESAIRITDNMAEAAYDWVKENARDIQARALAAEIFYCGIKIAMENGGQGSLRAGIIQAAEENLIEFGFTFIDSVWEIPDLWDVFEDAYDALDGELLGYSIIAWFLLTDVALDTFGADRPLEAIMAHATKHAAAHDNRDCAAFACTSWCKVFDFAEGQQDWNIANGTFSAGEFHSIESGSDELLKINRTIASSTIVSVRVKYAAAQPANTGTRRIAMNGIGTYGGLETGAGSFDTKIDREESGITLIQFEVDTSGDTSGENTISFVEVCGTGANPFL